MCISEFGKSGLILLWNPFITVQTFTYPSFLRWWNGYFQSIRIFGYNFRILNICVDISWAGKFHYIFFQVEARMPFSRVNGFDLCGLKLSSLAELNSPQLCFVFYCEVKPPIRICGTTMRGFPTLCLFYSWILFLIHCVIFRLDWKLHCSVLTAGEWTHWKTFESTLSAEQCRWVLCIHLSRKWVKGGERILNTHPFLWNIYQSHFPGLDKLMFWQQIKHRR